MFASGKVSLDERTALIAKIWTDCDTLRGRGDLKDASIAELRVVSAMLEALIGITEEKDYSVPHLYSERERGPNGRRPTAIEFFDMHWRERALELGLYCDDIKRADKQLYHALCAHQSQRGLSIHDLLPPSPTRGQIPELRTEAQRLAYQRVSGAVRVRRSRARWGQKKGTHDPH